MKNAACWSMWQRDASIWSRVSSCVGEQAGDMLRQYPDVLCEFWPELRPLVTLEQNNPWHCWGG